MKQASKEIEKKFLKLDEPVIRKSADIANGKRDIEMEDIQEPEKYLTPEEIKKIPENLGARVIPKYWSKCLSESKVISEKFGKDDDQLLEYISDINVVDEEGTDNFTIIFEFKDNGLINNDRLEKKFYIKNDEPYKTDGTKIDWKGKNLCMKETKKKQKNKKTGQQRVVNKQVEAKSFFNFFRTVDGNADSNPMEMEEEV